MLSITLIFAIVYVGYWTSMAVTYECITIGGLSSTTYQRFALSFHHTPVPRIKHFHSAVNADIVRQEEYCCSSCIIVGHCPWSTVFIVYLVNYCKLRFVNDFISCEIMCDCMTSILMHCPFKQLNQMMLCYKH